MQLAVYIGVAFTLKIYYRIYRKKIAKRDLQSTILYDKILDVVTQGDGPLLQIGRAHV